MVKIDDLFKRDLYPDNIKPLVDCMDQMSEKLDYENAKQILNKIKEELKTSKSNFPFKIETIKDVNDLITSNPIRLNPENYKFSDYLGLLVNVHDRKKELKGMSYSDIDRQRKVVAEEMACLGIVIPAGKKGIKPNRRFLDIANTINPDIACKELKRREMVLLWKAIEENNRDKIEKAKKNIRSLMR